MRGPFGWLSRLLELCQEPEVKPQAALEGPKEAPARLILRSVRSSDRPRLFGRSALAKDTANRFDRSAWHNVKAT